jgi:hypothetical protein
VSDHNRVIEGRDKSAWLSAACGGESKMSTSDLNSKVCGSRCEFLQVPWLKLVLISVGLN